MKVFVLPTWNRPILLPKAIQSVYLLGGTPLVVASTVEDATLARGLCEHVIQVPNEPLGAKFNAGWEAARELAPTHVVQWADDGLANSALKSFYDSADELPFGFEDLWFQDAEERWYWPGYCGARPDPIGLGRCIPVAWLDKCDWKPYTESCGSLDAAMHMRLDEPQWIKYKLGDTDARLIAVRTETSLNRLEKFEGLVRCKEAV